MSSVTVQPLAMPMTWPAGSFSLPKPSAGCPNGFVEGSANIAQDHHTGGIPTGIDLAGELIDLVVKL